MNIITVGIDLTKNILAVHGVNVRIPEQLGHAFHGKLDSDSSANWTLIPRQTGQSNRDVAVRGITVATSAIFTGEPHGQQQVIHAQDYRNTPPALRMRSYL